MLRKTSGLATGTYEYGLQRLSVEHVNEAKEYYLYNGTGNVTQTTAENGSMFLRYTYDAFGNVSSIRAPMTVDIDDLNRYTYNGEDYDYNTGLQYLRARYYSTGTGNFISQDTYLGNLLNPLSQNRYTYCHNNPVMYDDTSGHWLGAIIVVGFVGYGLYNIGDRIYDAHTTYKASSEPILNELRELAEKGRVVDTCGIVMTTLPDNMVYDEENCVNLMFDSVVEAQLYRDKVEQLWQLKKTKESQTGHAILDGIGMIPYVGVVADLSNALWYLAEGDTGNAAGSVAAMALEPICAWAYNNWIKGLFSGIEHHVENFFKGIFKKSGAANHVDDFFESVGDLTETTVDSADTSKIAVPDYSKADYYKDLHGGQSVDDALSTKHTANQGVTSANNTNTAVGNKINLHDFDNSSQSNYVYEPPKDVFSSFRDKMTPEEIARYDMYWNSVSDDMLKSNVYNYRQAILHGDITKTTGGKINSKVITAAMDTNTGEVYYGISGMRNNPTRHATNPQMQEILDSVDGTMTNYPLENCGEFNAINNALNNGADINALRVYSVDRVGGNYKAPCINCQNLYGDKVHYTE